MLCAAAGSGQRTMLDSMSLALTFSGSTAATMRWTCLHVSEDLDADSARAGAFWRWRRRRRARRSRARWCARRRARRGCRTWPGKCNRRARGGTWWPFRCRPPGRASSFLTHRQMGVPRVLPSKVPERIWTVSLPCAARRCRIGRAGGGPGPAGCRLRSSREPRRAAVHDDADSAAV